MMEDFKTLLGKWQGIKGNVIPLLQQTQELFGYLPVEPMAEIARATGRSSAEIYGVATFYAQFRFTPQGRHLVKICHGTACHVLGADNLDTVLEMELGIKAGETSGDGLFSIEKVACLGCCSLAPVVMIDGVVYGKLTGDKLAKVLRGVREKP
jgi:NADH:ubiquinone oxidoreductase subunit E